MALTPSTMDLPLCSKAPDFKLRDTEGKIVSRDDFANAPALLVMFICNHCPYVIHIRHELANVGREYQPKGVAIVAINSNDPVNYPADSPEKMKEEVRVAGYTFPYLFDADQSVAKAYRAACTPDFFLFDREQKLVYRGQFDDSRPRVANPAPVNGKDLRAALDAVLARQAVAATQKPSLGCNIKWKPGNAPDYFG